MAEIAERKVQNNVEWIFYTCKLWRIFFRLALLLDKGPIYYIMIPSSNLAQKEDEIKSMGRGYGIHSERWTMKKSELQSRYIFR